MKYRTVVSLKGTGEMLYGNFQELSAADLETAMEVFEQIHQLTYIKLPLDSDITYVRGDAIAYIKLEASRE